MDILQDIVTNGLSIDADALSCFWKKEFLITKRQNPLKKISFPKGDRAPHDPLQRFRGKAPDPKALLKRAGLVV